MWPAFALLLVIEGVMFRALPFSGEGPPHIVGALLLAMGLNLVVVAVLAPAAGWWLRRRRSDLPRPIATDVAGTALLAGLFVALLVAGVVNHSSVARDQHARAASFVATSRYVHAQAPTYAATLGSMDVVRVEVGMWRSCVPGDEPEKPLCLFVNTEQEPPGVTRDPSRIPNYEFQR